MRKSSNTKLPKNVNTAPTIARVKSKIANPELNQAKKPVTKTDEVAAFNNKADLNAKLQALSRQVTSHAIVSQVYKKTI